ncbi:alpha/beta fold hydrolase [Athalassotoga saccharophila]|uniref:alpha/beta fold hydrolase n=1 Tax=Athalassotoga saccharophila TaxID=1441386 RepID=UPI001379D93F|nr:alpha/beta hydrolase [Athalassotoga saccharophila]BBJ28121.1 3-oxoadipate enol-lactonase 2 [Athalassotoga saccharophila]
MPYTNNGIHYECNGHGDPLVLLNGIMMSTVSWSYHVERLKNDFNVITFDFKDQGKSSREDKDYHIFDRSNDLLDLMKYLKIESAHIVGVSYGAHVAEYFAAKFPSKVKGLVLSNATFKVKNHLREIGKSWEYSANTYDPELLFRVSFPFIYSRTFYDSNPEWIEKRIKISSSSTTKEWMDGFIRLSKSSRDFDLSKEIRQIKSPTLVISASEDLLIPSNEMKEMSFLIENSKFLKVKNTGHAFFLERPELFCKIIKKFLKSV